MKTKKSEKREALNKCAEEETLKGKRSEKEELYCCDDDVRVDGECHVECCCCC